MRSRFHVVAVGIALAAVTILSGTYAFTRGSVSTPAVHELVKYVQPNVYVRFQDRVGHTVTYSCWLPVFAARTLINLNNSVHTDLTASQGLIFPGDPEYYEAVGFSFQRICPESVEQGDHG